MTSMKMIQVIVHHMKMSLRTEPVYGLSKEKNTAWPSSMPMYDVTLKTLKYCNYLHLNY